MSARILIMAGGTGGHVYPALAVARALREQGVEISWLGTRNGLEARVVPEAGFPIHFISIAGLRGRGLFGWLLAPLRVARAMIQALGVVRRVQPGAVLGMGGFVTGPGGVAARLSGRALVIHEQNAVAGLTNRLLAPLAQRVLEAFGGTLRRAEALGNPVRADIAALAAPAQRLQGREPRLRLLVVGGSLGAAALNRTVPQALALLPESERPQVIHQTGEAKLAETRGHYREAAVEADVRPYLEEMAEAYGWADLVVCRAGALTVSELAAAGVAAVLVPFPFAVDDHQTRNGAYLADRGAALLIQQRDLSAERLADLLREFAADARNGRQRLNEMAQAARAAARPDATERVAQICLQLAGGTA